MINLHKRLGLAGVSSKEALWIQRLSKIFERLTMLVIIWLAIQWEMDRRGQLVETISLIGNWAVWLFFVIETVTLTSLVKNKLHYLKQNWMNLVIIIAGFFLIWTYTPVVVALRLLRPILILWLLTPWVDACIKSLSDNKLTTTLLTAFFIMILAGIIIAGIDPAIPNPIQGIWWAWVTMSTVGYGDVVPVSIVGKVFAAFLILMGLALFSVITANFSAIFVQREMGQDVAEVRREGKEIRQILQELHQLKKEEEDIAKVLKQIQQRLDKLEQ